MIKIILILVLTCGIFLSIDSQTIWAQTSSINQTSLPKMFNPTNIQSNIYNDTIHNFSILPPDGWSAVSQSNGTNDALVTFSNQNAKSLANFDIYYSRVNPIPQAIIALPNDEILNQSTAKLFDTTQFTILQKNIERFSDGFVIQAILEPKQNTQSSPLSEWFLFWLDDGRQYYLILTSSQNDFSQNQVAFERSVYTFYVGPEKIPTVPEFGSDAIIVFFIITFTSLIFLKIGKFLSKRF